MLLPATQADARHAQNVLLSAGSGLLLALMLEEILPIWRRNGFFYAICGEGAWTSVRAARRNGVVVEEEKRGKLTRRVCCVHSTWRRSTL
jgi:hypothetical protein